MLDTILNMFVTCIRAMIGAQALVLAAMLYLYVCSSFPPLGRLSVLLTYLNIWDRPETSGLVTAEPFSLWIP